MEPAVVEMEEEVEAGILIEDSCEEVRGMVYGVVDVK